MSRVNQESLFGNCDLNWSVRHAVWIKFLDQDKSCGAGWSSGHALGLLTRGLWVRDWSPVRKQRLLSAGEVFPNRTSPTEWAGSNSSGAIDAASTRYLQRDRNHQLPSQRVWWNRPAEKMTDHGELPSSCRINGERSWLRNSTSFVRHYMAANVCHFVFRPKLEKLLAKGDTEFEKQEWKKRWNWIWCRIKIFMQSIKAKLKVWD